MRCAGPPDVLEYRRSLAVQRVVEGYSTQEVAEFLGVDPSSVRRWFAAYRRHGGDGLTAQPVPGRSPKLTTTQEKIVLRWLSDPPTEYGFTTDLWSAPRLAQLIEQEFDTHFHSHYLSTWLRQRVEQEFDTHFHSHYLSTWLRQRGYTPQKPRRVPRERDDEAIARWLAEDWPRIKQKARRRDACLLLMDESGLLMAPLLRRSWAPRGHPSKSKSKKGHREKVSVAAALWLPPLRDRLHLAYQPLINGYFSNVEVAEFLGAAVQGLPGPVIALWDGGTMHKGDPIRALVEESRGRLDIEPLPAHAPELMPVEFLWRWLKYGRLCNFAPRDAHHLNEAVVRELDAIRDNQVLLSSFFHQSDLPLPRALLT
jgi:transposase